MAWSARPESPTLPSVCSSVLVPTAPPIPSATTTNASHPQIASLRCWALHTPARDARPRTAVSPDGPLWGGRDADIRTSMSRTAHRPYRSLRIRAYVIAYGADG